MSPPPRGQRLLRRAFACLLIGTLLTIAAAWACALWVRPPTPQQILISQHPELQETGFQWPCAVPPAWPPHPNLAFSGSSRVWREEIARAIGYSPQTVQVRLYRCGFPLPALEARRYSQWTGMMRGVRSPGITVPRWLGRNRDVGLPVRPVWPAFAIDTAMYAAIAFVAGSCFAALRSARRRARELCPNCGYDLRDTPGSVCPECGR